MNQLSTVRLSQIRDLLIEEQAELEKKWETEADESYSDRRYATDLRRLRPFYDLINEIIAARCKG